MIHVARLKFVECGDQNKGEYGFYEARVSIETRGLTMINFSLYNVTFCTRLNERDGQINPKGINILRHGKQVNEYDLISLRKLFLPELQKSVDKTV